MWSSSLTKLTHLNFFNIKTKTHSPSSEPVPCVNCCVILCCMLNIYVGEKNFCLASVYSFLPLHLAADLTVWRGRGEYTLLHISPQLCITLYLVKPHPPTVMLPIKYGGSYLNVSLPRSSVSNTSRCKR